MFEERRRWYSCAWAGGILSVSLLFAAPLGAATYPGAAPCNTTLQACIDGVPAGEVVEIATNTPIEEDLTIGKDLTLRSAPGFIGTILAMPLSQRTLLLTDASGAVDIRLEGLRLVFTTVAVLGGFVGSEFAIVDNHFLDGDGSEEAITAILASSLSLRVEGNLFEWTGPTIAVRTGGSNPAQLVDITISRNRITSAFDDSILGPSGNGVTVSGRGATDVALRFESNVLYTLTRSGTAAGLVVEQGGGFPLPRYVTAMSAEIFNNTFFDISGGPAIEILGAVVIPIGSSPGALDAEIFNNIVATTSAEALRISDPTGTVILLNDFNNFFDNGSPPILATFTLGASTFGFDPVFANVATGDLSLAAGSPAIDAGIDPPPVPFPLGPVVLGPLDVTGGPRVVGPTVDLGAYEFSAAANAVEIPTLNGVSLVLLSLVLAAFAWHSLRRSRSSG